MATKVPDPITGRPVDPCDPDGVPFVQDAADICLLAADLAQRGEAIGSGDAAAEAMGLDGTDSPAYQIAFQTFLAMMVKMRENGAIADPRPGGNVTPDEARDVYLEAATALQAYAATASAN